MKTISEPTKIKRNGRHSRWIPGGIPDQPPTQEQIDRFNKAMDEIAAQIEGLPPDLAGNHVQASISPKRVQVARKFS